MNHSERSSYETALLSKQAELSKGLRQRDGLAAEAQPDPFDEIQSALDRALVIQTLDRGSQLLREVRAALDRLRDGSYGECLRCEEPINPKRLRALPWAQFCIGCQEQADREAREGLADEDLLSAA